MYYLKSPKYNYVVDWFFHNFNFLHSCLACNLSDFISTDILVRYKK